MAEYILWNPGSRNRLARADAIAKAARTEQRGMLRHRGLAEITPTRVARLFDLWSDGQDAAEFDSTEQATLRRIAQSASPPIIFAPPDSLSARSDAERSNETRGGPDGDRVGRTEREPVSSRGNRGFTGDSPSAETRAETRPPLPAPPSSKAGAAAAEPSGEPVGVGGDRSGGHVAPTGLRSPDSAGGCEAERGGEPGGSGAAPGDDPARSFIDMALGDPRTRERAYRELDRARHPTEDGTNLYRDAWPSVEWGPSTSPVGREGEQAVRVPVAPSSRPELRTELARTPAASDPGFGWAAGLFVVGLILVALAVTGLVLGKRAVWIGSLPRFDQLALAMLGASLAVVAVLTALIAGRFTSHEVIGEY